MRYALVLFLLGALLALVLFPTHAAPAGGSSSSSKEPSGAAASTPASTAPSGGGKGGSFAPATPATPAPSGPTAPPATAPATTPATTPATAPAIAPAVGTPPATPGPGVNIAPPVTSTPDRQTSLRAPINATIDTRSGGIERVLAAGFRGGGDNDEILSQVYFPSHASSLIPAHSAILTAGGLTLLSWTVL